MNTFSWQRSEVPASTVHCYHTPFASRCSFDLAACRLDRECLRTRPGNMSGMHKHEEVLKKKQKKKTFFKSSLIERHMCSRLIFTKWHHLRTMWLFNPDWQFVLCANPPKKQAIFSGWICISWKMCESWLFTPNLTTSYPCFPPPPPPKKKAFHILSG